MFYFFKRGQYLCLAPAYSYGMLEMRSRLAVAGTDAPAVGQETYLTVSHRNHRFYRYAHAFLEHHAVSAPPVIGYLRGFVHFLSDAMTRQLADYSVALGFTMSLDGIANITHMISRNCHFDALVERLLGSFKEISDILADFTDTKCVGTVTIISSKKRATIDGNYISVL